jgi:hypothetical protein
MGLMCLLVLSVLGIGAFARLPRSSASAETSNSTNLAGWPRQKVVGMRTVNVTSGVSRVNPAPSETFNVRLSPRRYE